MLLKNPATGTSINENELPYFIRLKLEKSFITEDWISGNVQFEEIEQLVILHLNEREKIHRQFKNSRHKKKLKKYLIKECYIMESDKTDVYKLPDGNLILDIFCKSLLRVSRKSKKMNKNTGIEDLYTILNIKLVINSYKVIQKLTEISISLKSC